jgi:hypothetical protein
MAWGRRRTFTARLDTTVHRGVGRTASERTYRQAKVNETVETARAAAAENREQLKQLLGTQVAKPSRGTVGLRELLARRIEGQQPTAVHKRSTPPS